MMVTVLIVYAYDKRDTFSAGLTSFGRRLGLARYPQYCPAVLATKLNKDLTTWWDTLHREKVEICLGTYIDRLLIGKYRCNATPEVAVLSN